MTVIGLYFERYQITISMLTVEKDEEYGTTYCILGNIFTCFIFTLFTLVFSGQIKTDQV